MSLKRTRQDKTRQDMVMIKIYYMDMIIMMCGVGHCWYQSIDFLKGTDIFDKKW